MIPPLPLGRRRRPVPTDHRTLLDRVFPPEASDFDYGDLWATTGRSGLAYGAWSEPMTAKVLHETHTLLTKGPGE